MRHFQCNSKNCSVDSRSHSDTKKKLNVFIRKKAVWKSVLFAENKVAVNILYFEANNQQEYRNWILDRHFCCGLPD